jgi:hypothetical protein
MMIEITKEMISSHFAIVTSKHAASGERAEKLVHNDYREVVLSLIYVNQALEKIAAQQEALDSTVTGGFVTAHNQRQTLLNQERSANLTLQQALARFLMQELHWSKWDCASDWVVLVHPAMIALGSKKYVIPGQQ